MPLRAPQLRVHCSPSRPRSSWHRRQETFRLPSSAQKQGIPKRQGKEDASLLGRTPKGAYSTRGRSGHLLETPFSEPLLRTFLRTLFYCKTHRRPPSQNPSENPFPRTLPRTFSEPFSERCVAVRPLRRAPYLRKRPSVPNFWCP